MVKTKEVGVTSQEKKKILELLRDILQNHGIEITKSGPSTMLFKFPKRRIYKNQIDLVEFFTIIRYVDFGDKKNRRNIVVATIKDGWEVARDFV